MNSIFFVRKLSLLVVFFISSLIYTGCNQADQSNAESPESLEQEVTQSEESIVPIAEATDAPETPVGTDQNSAEETTEATETPVGSSQNSGQSFYRDETLGISFPQPEGVHIQAVDATLFIWTEADYERIEEFVEVNPLYITVEDNPDNLTAQEWLSTRSYNLEGSLEEQIVGNQPGIKFSWAGMWVYTSVAVPHPTKQKMVIITWDNDMPEYKGFFEDIVAGLEFI